MLKYHNAKPAKNLLGIFVFLATTSLALAAPGLATPDKDSDMKVSNSSYARLSFKINNSCSTEIGVIEAHSVQVVPRKNLNSACQARPTHCDALVYRTADCTGKPIAEVTFDVTGWGVNLIGGLDGAYSVGANRFNLFFVGPWCTNGTNNCNE